MRRRHRNCLWELCILPWQTGRQKEREEISLHCKRKRLQQRVHRYDLQGSASAAISDLSDIIRFVAAAQLCGQGPFCLQRSRACLQSITQQDESPPRGLVNRGGDCFAKYEVPGRKKPSAGHLLRFRHLHCCTAVGKRQSCFCSIGLL